MCFHWQHRALQEYAKDLTYKDLHAELRDLRSKYAAVLAQYSAYRDNHNKAIKTKLLWLFNFFIFKPIYNTGNFINPKLNWHVCKLRPDCLIYYKVPDFPDHGFYAGQLAYIRGQMALVQYARSQLNTPV